MGRHVASTKILDAVTIAAGSAVTSVALDVQSAEALAVYLTSITGTTPSATFTYSVAPTLAGPFITPQSPNGTIGATKAAVDVMDFAPEAAGAIKIITTNAGSGPIVITSYLVVQES